MKNYVHCDIIKERDKKLRKIKKVLLLYLKTHRQWSLAVFVELQINHLFLQSSTFLRFGMVSVSNSPASNQ